MQTDQRSNTRMAWFLIVLVVVQIACSTLNVALPTSTLASTETPLPTATNTRIPTETSTPSATPSATPVINGIWDEVPSLLTPRSAHAVVSTDSAIYALAGTDDLGKPILDVEVFNGTVWKKETALPGQGLNAPTASIVGQKLYVIGGFRVVSNVPTDQVQVYDLETKEWSMASPLPEARGGHAAIVLDDKIHVLGGGNSVSTIVDHLEYDPAKDTWTKLAPLPRSEGSPAAVVVDGKIYVIGGRSGLSDFGDVYIYDLETDTWSDGPAIGPRGTAGAVFYCGAIYLFGGESQFERKNLNSVLRLDPERNVWETVTAMPTPRKFARAVLFMDSVYIVGGSIDLTDSHSPVGTDAVERFMRPGCP